MHFLYAVINFLLLMAIIWLIGRKMIMKIFTSRQERINAALDEAEALERQELTMEALPEFTCPDSGLDDARALLDEQQKKTLAQLEEQYQHLRMDKRKSLLLSARHNMIDKLMEDIQTLITQEPYATLQMERMRQRTEMILSKITLTPGDITYLRTHNVLYVTLTSAAPLPEEIVALVDEKTTELLSSVEGKTSLWVKTDPSLIGGLRLRIGDTVYDCTISNALYALRKSLEHDLPQGDETAQTLLEHCMDTVSTMSLEPEAFQLGRAIAVSDGICWLDGLADIMYGEVVEFACGERGMILDIEKDKIGCIVYGDYAKIESGSQVRRVGRIASVPVGQALLGRVVDPMGHSMDGLGQIWTNERRPIEFASPAIPDRATVNRPLHTGLKAIDALVPIGKGQRELIIGDRQTGKTAIAIDAILNQKGKDVVCIYVAIGQKDTTVADIREKLIRHGAMEYTTIVCAPASYSASLQYIAPFAGAAMAEYFMYAGKDVLIVYDDLSKHAVAYRELSLLLHRPSGREAYPGDVFYLHSRLLERAAQLSAEKGGGSMTALPIIETQAGDISSYIPTNVISITDGQIFLESDLFNEGQRPAVNVGLSVSRVGGSAQTGLMKQVSASLRMNLAQYRELASFSQFGSDLDASTKAVLDAGERMMAALRQGRYAPLEDWQQALIIFAVAEGFADAVPAEKMEVYEESLYRYMTSNRIFIINRLKTGKKLSEEEKDALRQALRAHSDSFTL